MGTKGLGPYFQRVIATQVLDGLIYLICELYIDDVLIDGADEDTFVNNVRQVFARFRKHKIIVNPKKTELGYWNYSKLIYMYDVLYDDEHCSVSEMS
jgi:hypothetical protein